MKNNLENRTRYVILIIAIIFISGCAGTRVNNVVSSHDITIPAPRTIAVQTDVELAHPPRHESRETQLEAAIQAGKWLNSELEASFREHHLSVVQPTENPDVLLHNRIVDVRRGKRALRLLVGYGAGRAELEVSSSLQYPHSPLALLLSFQVKSTTGGMPGNVISGAVRSLGKDGLEVEVTDTVKLINEQLGKYFLSQGWSYSSPPPAARETREGNMEPTANDK